jgi:hypothetical protein
MANGTFFNAPVAMYSWFLQDHKRVLHDVVDYACYAYKLQAGKTFKDAAKCLHINYRIDLKDAEKNADAIYKKYLKNGGATVGVNANVVWDYISKAEPTERELMQFLGYMALKSIIGKAGYKRIINDLFLSRMAGETKTVPAKDLPEQIAKYGTRRRLDRLKGELIDSWGLAAYGQSTRGWFASFTIPLPDLIYHVEGNRAKNKAEIRRVDMQAAKEIARQRIAGIEPVKDDIKQPEKEPEMDEDLPF